MKTFDTDDIKRRYLFLYFPDEFIIRFLNSTNMRYHLGLMIRESPHKWCTDVSQDIFLKVPGFPIEYVVFLFCFTMRDMKQVRHAERLLSYAKIASRDKELKKNASTAYEFMQMLYAARTGKELHYAPEAKKRISEWIICYASNDSYASKVCYLACHPHVLRAALWADASGELLHALWLSVANKIQTFESYINDVDFSYCGGTRPQGFKVYGMLFAESIGTEGHDLVLNMMPSHFKKNRELLINDGIRYLLLTGQACKAVQNWPLVRLWSLCKAPVLKGPWSGKPRNQTITQCLECAKKFRRFATHDLSS